MKLRWMICKRLPSQHYEVTQSEPVRLEAGYIISKR
jgi:hypothetical protein